MLALGCSSSEKTGSDAAPADVAAPQDGPADAPADRTTDVAPDVTPDSKPDAAAADAPPADDAAQGVDAPATTDAEGAAYCTGGFDVAGAVIPPGFCLRRYAGVPEARTLAFAPNGDLFVSSPRTPTAGGAAGGTGAIVVLTDDDHDGIAELHTFADNLPDVHGLAVGPGFVYFTTAANIWRIPYAIGQRTAGLPESLNVPARFNEGGRWSHGLAISRNGELVTSRGEYSTCGSGSPGGEISRVVGSDLQTIASGFRNPMYLRCHYRDEVCAATELGEDQMTGAREKLIGLRPGTTYGYPCCYSMGTPVSIAPPGACAATTLEDAKFVLSDTPFGLDWEHDLWPEPYRSAIFVALHGSFYSTPSWAGARLVFARTDPATHMPTEDWRDFVGGFGPDGPPLERPSDVTFAPDGRLFFSDDHGGGVYWVAPTTLRRSN
jgi:glucose/arabinose dehydrogenase